MSGAGSGGPRSGRERRRRTWRRPLGGLLFGIGQALPFLVDAISYLVAFGALWLVRPALQGPRDGARRHLLAEVVEGIRWLWHQRLLRSLVLLIGVANFAFQAMSLALIVRAQQLGASPAAIGLMFGGLGAGAVVGALVSPWLQRKLPGRVVMVGALWVWVAQLAGLALLSNVVVIGALLAITGTIGPLFNVVTASYRYALAPDRLQARTISVARLVAWGTIPLASLAAGLLIEGWGPVATLALLTVLMVGVAVAATATPTIRRAPAPEALAETKAIS